MIHQHFQYPLKKNRILCPQIFYSLSLSFTLNSRSFCTGVGVDNDGILVLGATNIPWVLDSAIRRR